jgi:hypothetical protein
LQAARQDRLDVDLDLGCMGPCIELVGERFLTPKSYCVLIGLIADRRALDAAPGARLVHHEDERAGEHKCRHCGDEDQNVCVGSDIGPLDRSSVGAIQSDELVSPDPLAIT